MHEIELIATGGTIEKTYDESSQNLHNASSIVERMIRRLRLPDTRVHVRELMSKDSRELSDDERLKIARTVKAACELVDSVVVLHGTDTLAETGELIHRTLGSPTARVVLTGAIRPYEMKRSDALQNLTEALLASKLLPSGVYCVMHGQALLIPGAQKNYTTQTFEGPAAHGSIA